MADQTQKRTSSVAVRLGAVASLALGSTFVGAVNAKAADMHPKGAQPVAAFTDTGPVGKIVPADATAPKQGTSFSNGAAVFPISKGSLLANGVEGRTNYFIVAGEPPAENNNKRVALDGKGNGIAVLPGKPSDYDKVRLLDTPTDIQIGSARGDIALTSGQRTYELRGIKSVIFYPEKPDLVTNLHSPSLALTAVMQGKLGPTVSTKALAQPELSKLSPEQRCEANYMADNAKTVHDNMGHAGFAARPRVSADQYKAAAKACSAPSASR
jgi:hypothetical protein